MIGPLSFMGIGFRICYNIITPYKSLEINGFLNPKIRLTTFFTTFVLNCDKIS